MYALLNKYFFSAGYSFYKNQYTGFVIPVTEDGRSKLKSTYLNYGNADNLYFSFFMQQKVKRFWDVNFSATVNYATFRIKQNEVATGTANVYNLNYSFSMNNTLYLSPKKKWTAFAWLKYNSPLENIAYDRKNALFSFDLGLKKVVNKLSVSLFVTDIFYTNAKSTMVYQPNAAYSYNRLIQDNYTRSASLTIGYFLGNNKLRTNKNRNAANEEMKSRINK
jgi:iron complex outermembrane recepter protein